MGVQAGRGRGWQPFGESRRCERFHYSLGDCWRTETAGCWSTSLQVFPVHCEHPLTMTLFIPRLSGISMDVAVPENTGQGSAGEVEQCTCPPGYRGPSCQVSLGPPPLTHPTSSATLSGLLALPTFPALHHLFVSRTVTRATHVCPAGSTWAPVSVVTATATRRPVSPRQGHAR